MIAGTTITPMIDGGRIFPKAHELLQSAHESIQLEMYELGNREVDGSTGPDVPGAKEQQLLIPDIVAAATRGVHVQVLLDMSAEKGGKVNNEKMAAYLKGHGVEVLPYPPHTVNIDHVKCLVVDGKAALIGGMNWGTHSPANHDADVLVEGDGARAIQRDVFEKDWDFSRGQAEAAAVATREGALEVLTTAPNSEDGGSDTILQRVRDKIQHASYHAFVEMYTLTSVDVVHDLIDAKRRGADVRVILDPTEHTVNQKAFQALKKAGVPVRWYQVDTNVAQKLHAKWGEFDGESIIVGSANWSGNGLGAIEAAMPEWARGHHNHEADVAVEDAAVAATFHSQFLEDWDHHSGPKLPKGLLEALKTVYAQI